MQVQQITVFLVACTLSVLVVAYAQDEVETVLLNRLRNLAARVAAEETPDIFADVDDYKRGTSIREGEMCLFVFDMEACAYEGKYSPRLNILQCERQGKKNMGIHVHSGINFGKRRDSESGEARNTKRMRYHKGLTFGKRAPVQNWEPWQRQETYNPDWELGQFN